MMNQSGDSRGKVYLVGAGPGDPRLITVRGTQCLQQADVVLYDYLVNPRMLSWTRPGAELICLGRHGRSRLWSQSEINSRLVADARQGKCVVRLKGGDPAIFARAAEEATELARHQIPFEIVPGITAALAVSSYTGIPITHREHASAVAFVTGHEDAEKLETALDFEALARFPGTLVFYMGVTTAERWTKALLAAGKRPETPVAIVRRCSLPDQLTLRGTLETLPAMVAPLRPPIVIIVGDVVASNDAVSWFERRPLFGTRVMVTRPASQAAGLAEPLMELGAEVVEQPAIEILPPSDWSPVDRALACIDEFDWLVFSSANGVRSLLERLLASGRDLRSLHRLRLAAIGPGTADELTKFHLRADLTPTEFRAESLAAALAENASGRRFLLARASRGREVLAEQLRAAGGHVEQVVVYSSNDVPQAAADLRDRLRRGEIHWVTVTSSAIARSLVRLFGDDLRQARLVSISPITSETLVGLGFPPAAEASVYTMEGVVNALTLAQRESHSA